MAPKKVSIVEPPKDVAVAEEELPFSPPPESPEEIKARLAEEREAEQRELDDAWKKIPYVDQKDLGPGNYAGMEMMRLMKPWHNVWKCLLPPLKHTVRLGLHPNVSVFWKTGSLIRSVQFVSHLIYALRPDISLHFGLMVFNLF